MKYFAILATAAVVLLSGCATTIRSDVTAFNAWPADLQDKSYAFEAPPAAEETLEYRNYQVLVGHELNKLGFRQAADGAAPKLLVGMHFSTVDRPTRVLTATDPFWYGPYYSPGFYRHRWGYGYRPYFGYQQLEVEESLQHNYERQLHVTINAVNGGKLFDVTVVNTSHVQATPLVMPALVQSAFTGFPGQSGVARRVDLKIDTNVPAQDAVQASAQR